MVDAPLVEIRRVSHAFGTGSARRGVLAEVDADFRPGEIVILTGPSGSGKTTLLTLIGALRSLQEGSLRVFGQELAGLSRRKRVAVRRNIGFIFQQHNLFESLTALQNVALALKLRGPRREIKERAREALAAVGLEDHTDAKPGRLSGGQRQRVAIARALVADPRLVLADEPTAALDGVSGRTVVRLLQRRAEEAGTTVLLVTHDPRILDVADRILNLIDGRLVSDVAVERTIEICSFLKHIKLFSHLTPSALSEVAEMMVTESFAAGETIITQGDEGDRFYLVRQGLAKVFQRTGSVDEEKREVRSGDYFGEVALLERKPRNATVVASEDTVLFSLSKDGFERATKGSPSFEDQLRESWLTRRILDG